MNSRILEIKRMIEKQGYQFTRQKKIILEEIIKSETHLDAAEIYERLKSKKIGLATVYRNLNLFKNLGIVKEIFTQGKSYYEIKMFGKKPLHIHFKCFECDSIIDIDDAKINYEYLKLNHEIMKKYDVEIFDSNILFTGICNQCREEK